MYLFLGIPSARAKCQAIFGSVWRTLNLVEVKVPLLLVQRLNYLHTGNKCIIPVGTQSNWQFCALEPHRAILHMCEFQNRKHLLHSETGESLPVGHARNRSWMYRTSTTSPNTKRTQINVTETDPQLSFRHITTRLNQSHTPP